MARERIEQAMYNMGKSRSILMRLLADIQPEEWTAKQGGVTHLAWQAGHLAVAQYGLCLLRTRGERPEDEQIVSVENRKRYGRGSKPDDSAQANATCEELIAMLDAVQAKVQEELSGVTDVQLDVPLEQEHPMFSTKLQAVEFCPMHEMLHVGQVVLLRRLLGREPQF